MAVTKNERRINVLQLINSLDIGGAEKVAINLALHLDSSKYKSFICTIDGFGPLLDEIRGKDVEFFSLDKKPGFKPLISFKLAKYLREKKIDIITSHNYAPLLYGRLASFFAKVKAHIHVDHVRNFTSYKRKVLGNDKQLTSSIFKVIAVSEDIKKNLIKYEKVPEERIEVIVNGVDKNKYEVSIDKAKKLQEFNIPSDKKVIGICVRLCEQKGLIYLLDAVKKLSKFRNDFFVMIVGDGPLKDYLINTSKDYGISDIVRFTGFRNDIPEILQLIDIYVLPSLFEGLPLTLLEAMAAKKAIIVTKVGDNDKLIEEGKNGLLIPSKSSEALVKGLVKLLDNPNLVKKFGEEAYKEFLKKYTLDIMIKRYENLYELTINRRA